MKVKMSTKLQGFHHFAAHSASLAVSEQKATDNLVTCTVPQISAIEENLFHAAVTDHRPEMKHHRIHTNVESKEENKLQQWSVAAYTFNILQ